MEHPPSKRVKLFIDSCKTIEESIEKNAARGNSQDLLKHRNEFTQEIEYSIDSVMEEKTTDGKIISSNADGQERFTCHEYGFEKDSTNCEDHNSELMAPVQMGKHIKTVKYPRPQCLLIPGGTEDKASETELMLFGYKTDIQDNELLSSTTIKSDQVLDKSVILSSNTVAKDVKTQEGFHSRSVCSSYNFDNILTCESIKSEETDTSEMYVESVRIGQLQNQQREMRNIKQENQEFREKTQSNSITITSSGNGTMDNKESTLGIPFASKNSEIQKDSRMISQTETLDLETDVKQVNVQTSCLIRSSILNENAYDIDAQKVVAVCLEYVSSKNSSGLFVENIPVKRENEKNLNYEYDDTAVDKKSSKIQIYDSKETSRVTKKAQRIDNPLTVNKFIGTHGILHFKCDSVDASKAVIELISGRSSTNNEKKNQTLYRKQAEEMPLITQLQLSEGKRGDLMQKLPEISNCKDGYFCELNSSQLDRKFELLEATSLTGKKYLNKDNESFSDVLHDLCSHHNAESRHLMWLNVDFTLKDAVYSNDLECQPGSLFLKSFKAYENMSKRISVYEPSQNTSACHVKSDRSATSENKGEHELICMAKPDIPLLEKNVPLSEHHSGSMIQTECASKIEKSSSSNDSMKDHVDSAGISDVLLCSCENEEPEDIYVMEIPSTFTINNSALKSYGPTKISSENISKDQSDSIVACTKEIGIDISERETEWQMKYLCYPHYVKDRNCGFQTENTTHYSTYRVQSDWTSTLEHCSTFGCSVSDCLQLNTCGNTLLHSQKPGILGKHQTNSVVDTTCNKMNSTEEITICVAKDTSIQTSVACNLLKDTEVNNFPMKEGECQLKHVMSRGYFQGTDSKMQSAASNVSEVTLCLQGDKGQNFDTECLNKVCSLMNDNVLNCTATVPLGHNKEALCEHQPTSTLLNIDNGSEETTIVFSDNADIQTSFESSAKIEENNISAREVTCQQKYVSKSGSVKHTNGDVHKELNMLHGISHLDKSFRSHSDVATKKNTALSMVENNLHFNHKEEVSNEYHCTKILTTVPNTKKSTAVKITDRIPENGNVETSISYIVDKVAETNKCSEDKAECHLKCLTLPGQLKGFTSKVDIMTINELHPVPSLEGNIGKECEIGCANETTQFSNVCSLTKDNISLTHTSNILLGYQNKLVDEHLASPTAVLEAENSPEVTKVAFSEHLGIQNSSLTNYTSTRMDKILKREMESLQKCECGSNHFKQSDNDLHGKINVLYTASHVNTENTHDTQTVFSHNVAQFSSYTKLDKDTVSLSSPESISPLGHVNEILEEHQCDDTLSTDQNAKNIIEENAMICASKYANFQMPRACNAMFQGITVNNSSKHCTKPVNGQSCFISSGNDVATDLVNEFQETPQFEPSKMCLTQIKCADIAVQSYNTCNSFKDCSGLNSIINTSQNFEMTGELKGCNGKKTTAVTFSVDPPVKEKTGFPRSEVEENTKLVKLVKEENKQPGIKNNSYSKTTASAFDSFEKFTLNTDTEEQDTVTLIRQINCCNKEAYDEDVTIIKQIIYNNDNKSNEILSPQMSNFKSRSVEHCQSSINNANSGETKNVIVCEQDEKKYSNKKVSVKLQNRTKENNMHYVQTSQGSLKNCELNSAPDQLQQHIVGHKQVHTEPIVDENNKDKQELSGDVVSSIQNDLALMHYTQQEVSMQSLDHFAGVNGVIVKMDQKGQKQKTSEKMCELVSLGVDGVGILEETSHANDVPAICRHNLMKSMKPLQLKSKQELKQDVSTAKTQNSVCQIKSVNYSYIKESSDYETSTRLKSQGSLEHQKQRSDSIIGHGRSDYFEHINSIKGSTIPNVAEKGLKTQIMISKNEFPNFEMKEQFSAVLKELCLFHEISKQSDWSERVFEENVTELVNKRKDLVMLPEKNNKMNNSHVDQTHDNLQPFVHPCGKADQKGHNCLIGQEVLPDTLPTFAKTMSVIKGEQEVPMTIDMSEIDDEESLYIPHPSEYRSHGSRKAKAWSSAFNFQINNTRTAGDSENSKIGSYLSNGLLRIEPLKTCSGPIRVGLSKRIKAKHLHPYLR